jgi:group I intron endonuclease
MNIYSVYKATNKITNKVYIGFDSSWPKRWFWHKSQFNKKDTKFYRAVRKYGWNNFDWEIIYQSKDREHTLKKMESYFITEYNSYKIGYNSTLGGEGTNGYKQKEEHKRKIAESKIGKKRPPATEDSRKKMSESMLGKNKAPKTYEHRLKISKSLRGRKPVWKNVECPHCGKKCGENVAYRWHFDRCKMVNNQKLLAIEV